MTEPVDFKAIPNRGLITVSVMLATIMQALDSTIANVALPHIQSTLAVTQDEGAWVLTSYIVAAAVMFPLTGWLANTYGRREVFLVSIIVFVIASALCGAATSLPQLVLFRVIQGVGGAALVPLSQAILFEINDPKDYGRAMSIWGVGATLAPVLGPALGGWLTDNYSWRWVFYINLPIGILTFLGLFLSLPKSRGAKTGRFDFFGFATLSLAVASLQLMLDRGQLLDWFSSREITIEAILAGLGFYVFVVHMLSSEKPFVTPALFRDRNYVAANIFLFLIGIVAVCHSGAVAAAAADQNELSRGAGGPGDRAARHRHNRGHVLGRPPGAALRRPRHHGDRPRPHRLFAVADDTILFADGFLAGGDGGSFSGRRNRRGQCLSFHRGLRHPAAAAAQ